MDGQLVLPTRKKFQSSSIVGSEAPFKMEFNAEMAKQVIRDMHLKVTDQRLLILEVLHRGRNHVTAQEVFENVHKLDASVGFATVYRFLRNLTEFGHLTEIRVGGLPARYELAQQAHHDHLTCTDCGKICEFENAVIEDLQIKTAQQFGFRLTHHVLELYGICADCDQMAKYANGIKQSPSSK
jgi:Fur family ferric uptake transcriptional regulator